jgi:hypothetical protein
VKPIGFVEIQRKRGRIAGFGDPKISLHVLWCGTNRPRKRFGNRENGWSFPPGVRELLLNELQGKTCVHFFGGRADFGLRIDLDPVTNPDVVADAFLPPFGRNSFDAVILDPPYYEMRREERIALFRAASFVAREHVYWFHTVWMQSDRTSTCVEAWFIRTGDQCAVRVLQKFRPRLPKLEPLRPGDFTRGHPLKYNRWTTANAQLPFPDLLRAPASNQPIASNRLRAGKQIRSSNVFCGDWQ